MIRGKPRPAARSLALPPSKLASANAWAQARRLREYVEVAKGARDDRWVKWARGVADAIDPSVMKSVT